MPEEDSLNRSHLLNDSGLSTWVSWVLSSLSPNWKIICLNAKLKIVDYGFSVYDCLPSHTHTHTHKQQNKQTKKVQTVKSSSSFA